MIAEVSIELVPFAQKHVLGRLLQLYLYDFTEFVSLTLAADGEYPYEYLDSYWAPAPCESRYPYFIRGEGTELAGFAMVRVVNDVNVMAEFCVLRPYRRGGLGSAAAKLVFEAPWKPGFLTLKPLRLLPVAVKTVFATSEQSLSLLLSYIQPVELKTLSFIFTPSF